MLRGRLLRLIRASWNSLGLLALGGTAFVAAHLLADVVGAWPSVVIVAAVVGLVSLATTRPRGIAAP